MERLEYGNTGLEISRLCLGRGISIEFVQATQRAAPCYVRHLIRALPSGIRLKGMVASRIWAQR